MHPRNSNIISSVLIVYSLCSPFAFAGNLTNCPTLSLPQIEAVINRGFIGTEQGYTLSDESGKKPANVLIDEPTANPFDTYYSFEGTLSTAEQDFTVLIGNVLANNTYEAKDRVKQILLSDNDNFTGELVGGVCNYAHIDAIPSIHNYPFKSRFESIHLVAAPSDDEDLSRKINSFKKGIFPK